jgi:hypothetical protein
MEGQVLICISNDWTVKVGERITLLRWMRGVFGYRMRRVLTQRWMRCLSDHKYSIVKGKGYLFETSWVVERLQTMRVNHSAIDLVSHNISWSLSSMISESAWKDRFLASNCIVMEFLSWEWTPFESFRDKVYKLESVAQGTKINPFRVWAGDRQFQAFSNAWP